MAYVEEYNIPWCSKDASGFIYIDKLDGSGPSSELKLTSDGLEIAYQMKGYNEPIIGLTASLEILNDEDDFFTLMPLLTNAEREYQVRIYQGTNQLFQGFLNTAVASEQYRKKRPIRLTASNYLSKLKNLFPASVDTIQRRSLISLIYETLQLTGIENDIWVNCTLESSLGTYDSDQTLFNKIGVDTEVFWKDNTARLNGFDTITEILKPFNAYLYWFDGKWFIERLSDIWVDGSKGYIVYDQPDMVYGDNGTQEYLEDISTNIHDYKWTSESLNIQFQPGFNKIKVGFDSIPYMNQVRNDFRGILGTSSAPSSMAPNPRIWGRYKTAGFSGDWSIDSSGYFAYPRKLGVPDVSVYGQPYSEIGNVIFRWGWPSAMTSVYSPVDNMSIATGFRASIKADTTMEITWKWLNYGGNLGVRYDGGEVRSSIDEPEYQFRWWMRLPDEASNTYVKYNEDDETWYTESGMSFNTDPAWNAVIKEPNDINGAGIIEVTQTIDFSDVSTLFDPDNPDKYQDHWFVFGILPTRLLDPLNPDKNPVIQYQECLGDVTIKVSGADDNNFIEGDISTNFLNEQSTSLKLFDIESLNNRNGFFGGSDNYFERTDTWSSNGTDYYPIALDFLQEKFRIFQKTRQEISGTMIDSSIHKPLSIFGDSEQPDKQFILGSYTYRPISRLYKTKFLEYDNTTEVGSVIEYDEIPTYAYNPPKIWDTEKQSDWERFWSGFWQGGQFL